MFKLKLERLINEFGIKIEKLIELVGSNRGEFKKKRLSNDFTKEEQDKILNVYGSLLK